MKLYTELTEAEKKTVLKQEYEINKKSFQEIATSIGTYANKLRRDAIKYEINIRDKKEAQKNALASGRSKHPTKGTYRSEDVKSKIGTSVMKAWDGLDDKTLQDRKDKAKLNWEKISVDDKANMLREANIAVRIASKKGSKLETFLLDNLIADGYRVDFHKEQSLLNTKLQIDLFLPKLNIAIEVDGLSHFEPVWGQKALQRNQGYDNKKTGLILGKGLILIRVIQKKDFSKSRSKVLYNELLRVIKNIEQKFPDKDSRHIILGDK